jgi:hypothetical protein
MCGASSCVGLQVANSMQVLTLEGIQCPQVPASPVDDAGLTTYAEAVTNAMVQLLAVSVKDAKCVDVFLGLSPPSIPYFLNSCPPLSLSQLPPPSIPQLPPLVTPSAPSPVTHLSPLHSLSLTLSLSLSPTSLFFVPSSFHVLISFPLWLAHVATCRQGGEVGCPGLRVILRVCTELRQEECHNGS